MRVKSKHLILCGLVTILAAPLGVWVFAELHDTTFIFSSDKVRDGVYRDPFSPQTASTILVTCGGIAVFLIGLMILSAGLLCSISRGQQVLTRLRGDRCWKAKGKANVDDEKG